ncbi:uncharacterized protein PgNI_03893 [Pyricularia grisea]|uniref:Uncharacterized protein n=1 Tax=Pyricularia grisea TaxID=148305 RepID=A0A6P8B808_PYRGI|nr:uncharacterized protein PgNI_03893 [Pyricularia grisea]TLD11985.1 hypothetical protein PgNI_03893 [Pyricularia grisea]
MASRILRIHNISNVTWLCERCLEPTESTFSRWTNCWASIYRRRALKLMSIRVSLSRCY